MKYTPKFDMKTVKTVDLVNLIVLFSKIFSYFYFVCRQGQRSGIVAVSHCPIGDRGFRQVGSLKGHGNEADFLEFLQKLVPHDPHTLPFGYAEPATPRITDTESRLWNFC